MFSLELQTQARAAVAQTVQMLNRPAPPESAAQTVTASQSRTEAQPSAPDADERAMSACKAGRQGDVAAIPSLVAMLGDDSKTKLIACWSDGRWSPALQTFKHPSPGEQAAIALASLGRQAFEPLSQQLDSSKQALNDTEPTVSAKAAWAISEIED